MCDEIRRIFQESIQPMLMSSLSFSFIKNIVNKKVDKKHLLSFQDEDIVNYIDYISFILIRSRIN